MRWRHRTRALCARRRARPRIALAHRFNIKDQLRLRRNRTSAILPICQLPRNEKAAFSAHVHALKPRVPPRNHLMGAVEKFNRLIAAIPRRVELRPVGQISRVPHAQAFVRFNQSAGSNLRVDKVQRKRLRALTQLLANSFAHQRRRVVELHGWNAGDRVERPGARRRRRQSRDLWRQVRQRDATARRMMRRFRRRRPMRSCS